MAQSGDLVHLTSLSSSLPLLLSLPPGSRSVGIAIDWPILAGPACGIISCGRQLLNHSVMSNYWQPYWTVGSRLLCPCNFPGKNTGADRHFLLQGIFATQGSNPHLSCLLLWQVDSLPLTCGMRRLEHGIRDLVLWPGIKPGPPALGTQSPSHWATREFHPPPPFFFLWKLFWTILFPWCVRSFPWVWCSPPPFV